MDNAQAGHLTLERVCYGIAAAGGLISASCLSALPAATCTALAETYTGAVTDFGTIALMALGASLLLELRRVNKREAVAGAVVSTVTLLFVFSILANGRNLSDATRHCFVGTAAEIAAHQHDRIPILDAGTWWKVYFHP